MSLLNFFRSKKNETEIETVNVGVKIKVITIFLMAVFAVYIAYWVQDSSDLKTDLKADVLSSSTQSAKSQVAPSKTSGTQEVSIVDFHFEPDTMTVKKGTMVLWTNKDTVPHTVTGDNFGSESLTPGQSFSHIFQADGTYQYHCSFHPQMKGTVLAGTAGSPKIATEEPKKSPQDVSKSTNPGTNDDAFIPDSYLKENVNLKPSASVSATLLPADNSGNSLLLKNGATSVYTNSAGAPSAKNPQTPITGKLPESGPEDILYVVFFLIILYWQGKKCFRHGHVRK